MTLPSGMGTTKTEKPIPDVLRRYDIFDVQSSCVMKVESQLMLDIGKNHSIFVFYSAEKLSNLEVTRSDGKPLFIATSAQIQSTPPLRRLIRNLAREGENPIVILLQRGDEKTDDEHRYEEIDISWIQELGKSRLRKGLLGKNLLLDTKIRYNIPELEEANHYIEIRTSEKYEIKNIEILDIFNERIKQKVNGQLIKDHSIHRTSLQFWKIRESIEEKSNNKLIRYDTLTEDKRNKVFRFEYETRPWYVKLEWRIGIPKMVLEWLIFGASIGIFIPATLLLVSIFRTDLIVQQSNAVLPLVGAIIALLLGLRLLLFHDIELMMGWSRFYIGIIVFALITSIVVIYLLVSNG